MTKNTIKGGAKNKLQKFVYSIVHPIKNAKKKWHEKQLEIHTNKMATDPEYLDKVLSGEVEQKEKRSIGLGNFIGAFIVLLIGSLIFGQITALVTEQNNQQNVSTSSALTEQTAMMVSYLPLVYVIVVGSLVLGILYTTFRAAGVI